MNKVEEKLKAGRMKRAEGSLFTEESQRKQSAQAHTRKEPAAISSGKPFCMAQYICIAKAVQNNSSKAKFQWNKPSK